MWIDAKGENIFLLSGGRLKKIETSNNQIKDISFRAPFEYKPKEERDYMFRHAWQQVTDKFYTADIHGIDWKGYHKAYEKIGRAHV